MSDFRKENTVVINQNNFPVLNYNIAMLKISMGNFLILKNLYDFTKLLSNIQEFFLNFCNYLKEIYAGLYRLPTAS